MGENKKDQGKVHNLVRKFAKIDFFLAGDLDGKIADLENPWIGHEGPMEAVFERGRPGLDLLQRGIAFAGNTTVMWDESSVRVLTVEDEEKDDQIAIQSPVLVHPRFAGKNGVPSELERIDFLLDGVYRGSHYRMKEDGHA